MTHTLRVKHLLASAAVALAACAALAATADASASHARLYQFRGELLAASPTSVQLRVEGGNRPALRSLLGQSQTQTFAVAATTEILVWRRGLPRVGTTADLVPGDWVQVNVRAPAQAALAEVATKPAAVVGDHAAPPAAHPRPLYLYVGTVAGPQTGGHIALHVTGGNRRALRTLLGQPADQTFTYDGGTIFILWRGKVPTVIAASQLRAGDRITVRVRATRAATLAQVEATPARHVGDHEPAAR